MLLRTNCFPQKALLHGQSILRKSNSQCFPIKRWLLFLQKPSPKQKTSRWLDIFQIFPPCIQNALFSSKYSERIAGIEATSIIYTKVLLLTHASAQHPDWGCPYTANEIGQSVLCEVNQVCSDVMSCECKREYWDLKTAWVDLPCARICCISPQSQTAAVNELMWTPHLQPKCHVLRMLTASKWNRVIFSAASMKPCGKRNLNVCLVRGKPWKSQYYYGKQFLEK